MPTKYQNMTPEQKKKVHLRKKEWALKNRDKIIKYKRKHYNDNKEKFQLIERNRQYKKLYGITLDDYNKMFDEQKGCCAICGNENSIKGNKKQNFSVDHCHKTGKVRGLLCLACNSLLGRYEKLKINIEEYLK